MRIASWTLGWLRPHKGRVLLITSLIAIEVALAALAPWPLKTVVDSVLGTEPLPPSLDALATALTGGSTTALLILVVVAGLFLQLASELVLMAHTQLQVATGQRIVYDLRAQLLSHVQALGLRHHLATPAADSVYRLETDAYSVNDLVMGGLFPLGTAALKLAVMFVILASLDLQLALLALTVVPFLYAALRYYSTRMTDRAEGVKAAESRLIERLFEILSSIKVVKSFARERHELERFVAAGDETRQARLTLTWQESLFSVVVSTITLTGTALVLTVGGLHVLDGRLTVGGLLVVIAYLAAVYNPLSAIAHTTGSLQQAVVSARRVQEIFALTPEPLEASNGIDATGIRGHIRFEHVEFSYEAQPVRPDSTTPRIILHDISFEARPGELVAIVGLTGAGKTTLASLIPRFFDATAGEVLIDDVDVRKYQLRSLRERIALVPQETALFAGTIADNIRYGRLNASKPEVEAAARTAHIDTFVSQLPHGYDTLIGEGGATLSGGERQRLGIARAVLKDAPILILDEPTSALDALSEELVFNALRTLRGSRTTVVIAHRLSTIRDADRILVLHEGRVAAQGTHRTLLQSNDLYRRMCARLSLGGSLDDPEPVDDLIHAVS